MNKSRKSIDARDTFSTLRQTKLSAGCRLDAMKLRQFVAQAVRPIQNRVGKLGDQTLYNRPDPLCGIDWAAPFGAFGPGHGLAYPREAMALEANEPNFTRAFAGIMDEARIFPAVAHARAVSFLRVVAAGLGGGEFTPPDYGTPVTVSAEQKHKDPRHVFKSGAERPRLDLCFQWHVDTHRKILGIEVKFGGNGLQSHQIEDYSEIMNSLKGDSFGIFLSCRRCSPEALENEVTWRQRRWWGVMRAWETELATAPSAEPEAFGGFRASLWDKIVRGYIS
jgi:hypothetical protein